MTEFAMNNAAHASTVLTPFFFINTRHPRFTLLLGPNDISTIGGGTPDELSLTDSAPTLKSPPCDRGDKTDGLDFTGDTVATTSPCDHGDPRTVFITENPWKSATRLGGLPSPLTIPSAGRVI
uniref:Uncharacterized protein n=1 Tax=Peronospora matthiolae TaxID=2874970 RepID=A0AAV1UQC9_9STRA